MDTPHAATTLMEWVGSSHFLTIVGAFVADAYLGRYYTIVSFTCIYAIGMCLLTYTATAPSMRPARKEEATFTQIMWLYIALGIIALGTGGIKPCISTMGADQFDEKDKNEARKKYSFFNWFFFAINLGGIFGIIITAVILKRSGYSVAYGLPAAATVVSLVILMAGNRMYRYQKPTGSPLTRFAQVVFVAYRNHKRDVEVNEDELYEVKGKESDIVGARKLKHTEQYSFLDKAAVPTSDNPFLPSRWQLCTVTQVEELKAILRILPIFFTTLALSISISQMSTYFVAQSQRLNRKVSWGELAPGCVLLFFAISSIVIVPLYSKVFVPILRRFTGRHRGITSLQRIGTGLFISIFAMAWAAHFEHRRRLDAHPERLSVFLMFPQLFLIGVAEVFTYVGLLEFFYDESTDGTRSICSALLLVGSGFGHFLSTGVVHLIVWCTGKKDGWLVDDLNLSKLDYFYWVLAFINAANLVAYVVVACRYKGKDPEDEVTDEVEMVKWDQEEGSSRRILH